MGQLDRGLITPISWRVIINNRNSVRARDHWPRTACHVSCASCNVAQGVTPALILLHSASAPCGMRPIEGCCYLLSPFLLLFRGRRLAPWFPLADSRRLLGPAFRCPAVRVLYDAAISSTHKICGHHVNFPGWIRFRDFLLFPSTRITHFF